MLEYNLKDSGGVCPFSFAVELNTGKFKVYKVMMHEPQIY